MIRLLDAGFTRLKKDKFFWSMCICVVFIVLLVLYNNYSNMKKYDEIIEIDRLFFFFGTFLGIMSSIFTSVFLGTEYSNGTLRNKIIMGHKRFKIYLSNLIITSLVNIFFVIIALITVAIVGTPIFEPLSMSISVFILLVFDTFCFSIAYSSIFTFISMLFSNKTTSAITCIIIAIILLIIATVILNALMAPEMITNVEMVDGEMIMNEVPNSRYLKGDERVVYERILDIIPAGQAFNIMGGETNFFLLPFYSLGVILIFTIPGLYFFDKKELN